MKKFLAYLCVIILTVSLGFAVFYLVKDNEVISLTTTSMYKDAGTSFELSLNITKPNSYTTVEVSSSNEDVLKLKNKDIEIKDGVANGIFIAEKGGIARINFQTNNSKFRNLYCDVVVGDGTQKYPYHISTATQLAKIGAILTDENDEPIDNPYTLDACYDIVSDIDLGEIEGGWKPLGYFNGIMNGNGYSFINMNIRDITSESLGLFECIGKGGVIKNAKFNYVNIKTTSHTEYVGVVAGINNGTIERIEINEATIYNSYPSVTVGGVAGYNKSINTTVEKATARIDRCSSSVAFYGAEKVVNEAGELVSPSISMYGTNIGGITGHNHGAIVINSYAKGIISINTNVTNVGGIVGYNQYLPITGTVGAYTKDLGAHIKDTYSIVKFEGLNATYHGQILGSNNDDTIDPINKVMGNYYDNTINQSFQGAGIGLIIPVEDNYVINGITTSELKIVGNLYSHELIRYRIEGGVQTPYVVSVIKWNTRVWLIGDANNNGYPVLNYADIAVNDDLGDFSDAEIIKNVDPDDLRQRIIDGGMDGVFVIEQDFDLTGIEWQPIGTYSTPYRGSIMAAIKNEETGERYSINNLTITNYNYTIKNSETGAGFFGIVGNGANITNLHFKNVNISSTNGHQFAGAVASLNGFKDLSGGIITDCIVSNGVISAIESAGGIVGMNNGTINYCTVEGADITDELVMLITVTPTKLGNIGAITGVNFGDISGYDNISGTEEEILTYSKVIGRVKLSVDGNESNQVNIGGIAGDNRGLIYKAFVDIKKATENQLMGLFAGNDVSVNMGGIAGYSSGTINNGIVSIRANASTSKKTYVAGAVGYLNAQDISSQIQSTNTININNVYVYDSDISGYYCGGLAGYITNIKAATVNISKVSSFTIEKSTILYISEDNYKKLYINLANSSVQDSVTLKGNYVAGLASILNNGYITDCYSHAILSGINNAGFVFEMCFNNGNNTGGVVNRCYVLCNFSGGNKNYNVSSSDVRWQTEEERSAGVFGDYYYNGNGKEPKANEKVLTDIINFFTGIFDKDESSKLTTKKREIENLKVESLWSKFSVQNIVSGDNPWIIVNGEVPTLKIDIIAKSL